MKISAININGAICPSNHYCPVITICPAGAIEQGNPFQTPVVNKNKCTLCQKCLKSCPYRAIEALLN